MLKQLRKKFILVNMLLVAAVLLAVFAVLYLSTYRTQKAAYDMALEFALDRPMEDDLPKVEIGEMPDMRRGDNDFARQPAFCVLLDGEGNVVDSSIGPGASVTDEVLAEAVAAALRGKTGGTLPELALSYKQRQTPEGLKVAFVDIGSGQDTLRGLLFTSLLVIVLALSAFFVISLFLSKWALRPVQRAWEQQSRFVADASHELKTPLTVILANQDILLSHREETVEAQLQWVENTRAEGLRMKKLINDMLYLAKGDAGAAAAEREEVNLSDTLWSALLPFEAVAFEKGVELETDIANGVHVTGGQASLHRLCAILIDNAVKYAGEKGRVSVSLSGSPKRLVVTNTGAPISQEDLPHIFERFYRADKARGEGGYGLGLSIAQGIAAAHGACITAESGEATRFTVIFN